METLYWLLFTATSMKELLTEIDTDGKIQRQYLSSFSPASSVNLADMYGRIVIATRGQGIELLDSELNPLDFDRPIPRPVLEFSTELHYNSERNEVMSVCCVDCLYQFPNHLPFHRRIEPL